jgi:hypothetical protein
MWSSCKVYRRRARLLPPAAAVRRAPCWWAQAQAHHQVEVRVQGPPPCPEDALFLLLRCPSPGPTGPLQRRYS